MLFMIINITNGVSGLDEVINMGIKEFKEDWKFSVSVISLYLAFVIIMLYFIPFA